MERGEFHLMVKLCTLLAAYERRASNYGEALRAKCDELSLDAVFMDSLMPSSDLLYHNKEHMVNVAFDADFLAKEEGVNLDDRRKLFVAGFYHDVNHTGVAKPDSANIALVEEFLLVNSESFKNVLGIDVEKDLFPLIHATNTDFYNIEPSFLGGILRDADLLAWAYKDFDVLARALSSETGSEVSLESTRSFFGSVSFFTGTAVDVLSSAGILV